MKAKILFTFILYSAMATYGQDTLVRKNTVMAAPIVFRLPETGWGVGAMGAYNFYVNKKDSISPPSQVMINGVYTEKRQLGISIPYQFFWDKRKHFIGGEVGYYDLNYLYFGIGNTNVEGYSQKFNARHLQFRINYLRKLKPHIFVGARYWFDSYNVFNTSFTDLVPAPLPRNDFTNITSGPGLVFLYDTRNNIYNTTQGQYLELVAHNQNTLWGSRFNYNRLRFDYRYFLKTTKKQAITSQLFGDFLQGNVPFNQLASIGSSKRMRGYYDGRFRNKNLLLAQLEYRTALYKRFGAVAFINYALIYNKPNEINYNSYHASAGVGLRFSLDREKRINARFDISWPLGTSQISSSNLFDKAITYFTIGEAF
jgi:hemolysin activation/secretion protein